MNHSSRREFLKQAAAAAAATTIVGNNSSSADHPGDGMIRTNLDVDETTGTARAMIVGNEPLAHTEQVFAGGKSDEQCISDVFNQIQEFGFAPSEAVKWNFYVARNSLVKLIQSRLAREREFAPAVTFVTGELASPGSIVAADCISILRTPVESGMVTRKRGYAVLPPGHKLYVSGDARSGNLEEATRATLDGLEATLKFAGLDWSHVVQLKSFMEPIAEAEKVRGVIRAFFGDRPVPVQSFVEWKSPSVPIEIELIAAVPAELGNKSGESVEYLTPPGMTASPVFSRAARISSSKTIYVSGLYGEQAADPPGRIREILKRLDDTITRCGGDMKHLAKATYYVTDDETSAQLGKIRPEFYDPARPPAASKALVRGVGRDGHTIAVDMIAVPKPG